MSSSAEKASVDDRSCPLAWVRRCARQVNGEPCLAYWLRRHGFEPTIVERAPTLRTGGYIVDFWGAGFDVAERMALLPQILGRGYRVREVRQVDRRGKRISGFSIDVFDRMTAGWFTSVPRGELAASIYESVRNNVETIFDDCITAIEDSEGGARVHFSL